MDDSLLWVAAVGCAGTGTAWSQSAEMVGVNYRAPCRAEGVLVLNSSGVSYRGMSKQYTVGLYTPRKSDRVETAMAGSTCPCSVRWMLQNLRMTSWAWPSPGAWKPIANAMSFSAAPAIRTMAMCFAHQATGGGRHPVGGSTYPSWHRCSLAKSSRLACPLPTSLLPGPEPGVAGQEARDTRPKRFAAGLPPAHVGKALRWKCELRRLGDLIDTAINVEARAGTS